MTRRPYGLVCPISRACEFLEPRWTIQILTELWNGSTRFNDIRKRVGNVSSALLSGGSRRWKRLGLVERVEDEATGTIGYFRSEKSIKLEPAMNPLAEWAQCNIEAEIALGDVDVSTLMWALRRKIDLAELPRRRAVIRFHFRDDPPPKSPVTGLWSSQARTCPSYARSTPAGTSTFASRPALFRWGPSCRAAPASSVRKKGAAFS